PSSKHQAPGKHQAPNFNRRLDVLRDRPPLVGAEADARRRERRPIGPWDLELPWSNHALRAPLNMKTAGIRTGWFLKFGASLKLGVWSLMLAPLPYLFTISNAMVRISSSK